MVKLLVYGDCTGKPSSRRIEKASYEEVLYRVLAANQHPDHDSLAAFRQQHLSALAGLFIQVLALCQRAGLVSPGHAALDGTKVLANASEPDAEAQPNFTDPESRIMKDGATKSFVQAYNAQAAVDGAAQIIVAGAVTHEAEAVPGRVDAAPGVNRRDGEVRTWSGPRLRSHDRPPAAFRPLSPHAHKSAST